MSKRSASRTNDGRSGSSSITRRQALRRVALGAAAVGAGSVAWPAIAVPAALVEAQCRFAGNGGTLKARFSVTGLDPSLGDVTAKTSVQDCSEATLHYVEAVVGFEDSPEVINTEDSHYLADLDPEGDLRTHLVWRNAVTGAGGVVVRLDLEQGEVTVFSTTCPVEGSPAGTCAPTLRVG